MGTIIVPFNKTGLYVKPNMTQQNRKKTNSGFSSYHKKRTKSKSVRRLVGY